MYRGWTTYPPTVATGVTAKGIKQGAEMREASNVDEG
jgi:hypothetical protein